MCIKTYKVFSDRELSSELPATLLIADFKFTKKLFKGII